MAEEKERAGWERADFLHNIAGLRYPKNLETTVYRIAQEALTNARKHAQTDRIRLTLLAELLNVSGASQLTLEIRDWGHGFLPEQRAEDYEHIGLHGMAERANLIGGAFRLQSALGAGTTIEAVFPVVGTEDHAEGETS